MPSAPQRAPAPHFFSPSPTALLLSHISPRTGTLPSPALWHHSFSSPTQVSHPWFYPLAQNLAGSHHKCPWCLLGTEVTFAGESGAVFSQPAHKATKPIRIQGQPSRVCTQGWSYCSKLQLLEALPGAAPAPQMHPAWPLPLSLPKHPPFIPLSC